MQTRRDQLQAYRFQNRRALAALVTGQPNVLEPPMRRLTVTTLSGIMIAILIAIVFGVLAIIHPSAGDSWKTRGSVIVDQDSDTIFIYSHSKLYPVLNKTSAVLAVSGTSAVKTVDVSSGDIAGAKYGREIGIAGVPPSLPSEDALTHYPISACSVQEPRGSEGIARVTLHLGSEGAAKAVPSAQAILVTTPGRDKPEYLLFRGQRLPISSRIASTLGYSSPVQVGNPFITSVPRGTPLAPPTITGFGKPADYTLVPGMPPPRVGTVVMVSDPTGAYLVLQHETVPLTALEVRLFSQEPTITATRAQVTAPKTSSGSADQNPLVAFDQLPPATPSIDRNATESAGVCAVFRNSTDNPSFVLPSRELPSTFGQERIIQSNRSTRGLADKVDIPAMAGMLATASNAPHTALIVSDQGVRYGFANTGLLSAFGYTSSDVVKVPPQLLAMIPGAKNGLSRPAALHPVMH